MNPRYYRYVAWLLLLGGTLLLSSSESVAQRQPKGGKTEKKDEPPPNITLPDSWTKAFKWRNIGPANMGGRITAISVFPGDTSTYWVATASGGLLKTTNNGVSFEHQFDKETTVSIGDVCVAPSNPNIVWVGTGENNPRNSVSFGDGVYKSTDGGKKWTNMGLKQSFQIGKILVHPTNPDIVYVGALGRLYGSNPERGLFKTTDGGKTWAKIHYIDDKTGVIDMRMHPTEPDTLYVATWDRARDGFDSWPGGGMPDGYDAYDPVRKWGPGAGIFKTTDGGKTFKKLTKGLPTNNMGRIGLDIYLKDPNTLYAIIDCEKIGMGAAPRASTTYMGIIGEDAGGDAGAKLTSITEGGPAEKAGLKADDVVVKMGEKKIADYQAMLDVARDAKPNDKVKIAIKRGDKTETLELTYGERPAQKGGPGMGMGGTGGFGGPGGPTATRPNAANYGGQAANLTAQGANSHEYGGVYMSKDAGESWTRINSVNPRPMYFSQVRVDPTDSKYLYVLGVSMYRSTDGGRTFQTYSRGIHADQHALWIDPKDGRHQIIGTDGGFYVTYDRATTWDHINNFALGQFYHVAVCNKKPYFCYGGLQDNGCWGIPSMSLRGAGPVNEDVISINGGDGYVCRVDPNDPDQIYAESQNGGMVRYNLRTNERGSIKPVAPQGSGLRYRFNWNTPYVLSHHNSNIVYMGGNYIFKSVKKGSEPAIISPEIARTKHGTATAISESPLNSEVIWAGTDDGYLWLTKNGGKEWVNLTEKLGLKKPLWIATIEASRFAEGRAYIAFDGHRLDDDAPYVYMTDDFGQTWKNITKNLPTGSTRVVREDIKNPNLLYCGTEFGFFVSLDRGGMWTKFNNNLPTVAVHEVAIHPTAGEIVVATHGRSLWITDVTALRQMASESVLEKPTLFKPNTLVRWQQMPSRPRNARDFVGENPSREAQIYVALPKAVTEISLKVQDIDGKDVATIPVPKTSGLHRLEWNTALRPAGMGMGMGGGNRPMGGGGGRQAFGRLAPQGSYRLVLTVDGVESVQSFSIEGDPVPLRSLSAEDEEEGDDDR